jgi:hypothetical protein
MARKSRSLDGIVWLAVPFSRIGKNPLALDEGFIGYFLEAKTEKVPNSFLWGKRVGEVVKNFKPAKFKLMDAELKRLGAPGESWPSSVVDLEGLAELSGYSKLQITRWVRKGGLPHLRHDNKLWFLLEEVDDWLEEAEEQGKVRGRNRGRDGIPKNMGKKHLKG